MKTHFTQLSSIDLSVAKKNSLFSSDELALLDKTRTPHHIAIIPDGNRRWAKKNLISTLEGHQHGCDVLLDIVQAAQEIGVKAFTFYAFSTENWLRPKEEVAALMKLLETYLINQRQRMHDSGVRLMAIGNQSPLPERVKKELEETQRYTADCSKIDLILAINYGGRDEIRRAVCSILEDYDQQKITKEEITEAAISRYLDTSLWPDPDLFIRTSGEQRISNFLLWQLSYSEFYLPHVLWPDFTPQHLLEAVIHYQQRQRRLGE